MAPVNGSSRKRRRIPPSCLSCRKRKTKCDRQRPFCGRCATDGIKSDCVYEATSEVLKKSEGQRLKIDSLKSKIKLLEETIELKNSIIESYSDGNGPAAKIRGTLGHLINPKDPPTFNLNLPILAKENQDFDGFVMINSFLVYQGPTSFIANFQRDENTKAVFDELNKHLHENTMPDKAVFK